MQLLVAYRSLEKRSLIELKKVVKSHNIFSLCDILIIKKNNPYYYYILTVGCESTFNNDQKKKN